MTTRTHTLPWRLGSKLDQTFHGAVTIYDGTPNGDGGRHGRFVAVAFTQAIGCAIVSALNTPPCPAIVDDHLSDPRLWVMPTTSTEAALQAALRQLHAAIGSH